MTTLWLRGYVQVIKAFDAENCPNPVPAGFGACMVYAGGSSAAHAWTEQELALVAHLPRLPVWVPTPGVDDPLQAAAGFAAWLKAHQVPALNRAGEHTRVMWDLETGREPDPQWLNRAADHLGQLAGVWNLVYGSVSTLFGQPQRAGYVVADFPQPPAAGQLHLYQRPGVVATQYSAEVPVPGGVIDEDVFTAELARQIWLPPA